ncbi:MAG: hypothetical protein ACPG5P_06865, partial [Saprospiraceae bacterium]
NTKKYKNRTKEKIKDSSEETDFFIIDSGQVVNYEGQEAYDLNSHNIKMYDNEDLKKWYNESHQDSLFDVLNHTDDKVHILDSLKMEMEKEKNNSNNSPKIATTNSPEIKPKNNPKPKTKKPKGIDPFCKEYTSWYGTRYILQDGVYSSRSIAQKRIEQINKATALGGILKGGCFKQTRPYYTVYVDKVFTKKSDAEKALPFFNQLLKDKGYSSGELILVDITVKR